MKNYNIVYIHTHDTGRYIDPYGYSIGTPNLLDFAKGGVTFRDCHDAAPTCSPARACLLTGTYAYQNGQVGLVNRGIDLVETDWHMASFFGELGYDTVLAGIQHEHIDYKKLGYKKGIFSKTKENHDNTDEANTKNAVDYIMSAEKPYFLSIGYIDTHRVFPEPSVDENFVRPPEPIADNKENRRDFAGYITSARHMDANVGKVLSSITESGQWDNTIVFFTTDHGLAMPRMKCNLYGAGTGVSLIMKYPNMKQKGISTDSLCSHLDIYPTLCDVLDIEKPEWLMGVSQLPVMAGDRESVRDEIHAEVNHHTRLEVMRGVRTKRYSYIKSLESKRESVNCDISPPKVQLMAAGYYIAERPMVELYDLLLDPHEFNNLAESDNHKDILTDMDNRLIKWMKDTNDPFLVGEIPLPYSTVSNFDDGDHPGDKTYCEGDPSINGEQNVVVKQARLAYKKLLES